MLPPMVCILTKHLYQYRSIWPDPANHSRRWRRMQAARRQLGSHPLDTVRLQPFAALL